MARYSPHSSRSQMKHISSPSQRVLRVRTPLQANIAPFAPLCSGNESRGTLLQVISSKTRKGLCSFLNGLSLCGQRPTLPHTFACNKIRPSGLKLPDPDGTSIGSAYDIGERILWRR